MKLSTVTRAECTRIHVAFAMAGIAVACAEGKPPLEDDSDQLRAKPDASSQSANGQGGSQSTFKRPIDDPADPSAPADTSDPDAGYIGGSAGSSMSTGGGGSGGEGGNGAAGSGNTAGAGTGGSGGGGAAGAAGSGGQSTDCAAAPQAGGSIPLIDDLNHTGTYIPTNESRGGVWDVWTLNAAATMSPSSGAFTTTDPESDGYIHWTGTNIGGTDDWGPTLTVQLNLGCPYNASVYTGISFKLQGTFTKTNGGSTTPAPLKVNFWKPQAVPSSDAVGGQCVAAQCYNNYSTYVSIPANWDTPVTITFGSLTQSNWTGTIPFAWDASDLLAIQFQLEVDGSVGEIANFDVSIDDLSFVP